MSSIEEHMILYILMYVQWKICMHKGMPTDQYSSLKISFIASKFIGVNSKCKKLIIKIISLKKGYDSYLHRQTCSPWEWSERWYAKFVYYYMGIVGDKYTLPPALQPYVQFINPTFLSLIVYVCAK